MATTKWELTALHTWCASLEQAQEQNQSHLNRLRIRQPSTVLQWRPKHHRIARRNKSRLNRAFPWNHQPRTWIPLKPCHPTVPDHVTICFVWNRYDPWRPSPWPRIRRRPNWTFTFAVVIPTIRRPRWVVPLVVPTNTWWGQGRYPNGFRVRPNVVHPHLPRRLPRQAITTTTTTTRPPCIKDDASTCWPNRPATCCARVVPCGIVPNQCIP